MPTAVLLRIGKTGYLLIGQVYCRLIRIETRASSYNLLSPGRLALLKLYLFLHCSSTNVCGKNSIMKQTFSPTCAARGSRLSDRGVQRCQLCCMSGFPFRKLMLEEQRSRMLVAGQRGLKCHLTEHRGFCTRQGAGCKGEALACTLDRTKKDTCTGGGIARESLLCYQECARGEAGCSEKPLDFTQGQLT